MPESDGNGKCSHVIELKWLSVQKVLGQAWHRSKTACRNLDSRQDADIGATTWPSLGAPTSRHFRKQAYRIQLRNAPLIEIELPIARETLLRAFRKVGRPVRIRQQYPYWAKEPTIGLRTINAKAETITTAPAFRGAIKYRRCLVPADAFYEWARLDAKTKQPFAIAMKDGNPIPLGKFFAEISNSSAFLISLRSL